MNRISSYTEFGVASDLLSLIKFAGRSVRIPFRSNSVMSLFFRNYKCIMFVIKMLYMKMQIDEDPASIDRQGRYQT